MALGPAFDKFPTPFEGCYSPRAGQVILSRITGEVSAEMVMGRVVQDNATGDKCLNITAAGVGNKFIGILGHEYSYVPDVETGLIGIKPNKQVNIIEQGEIYVVVDEAVTPASPVRMRATASGGGLGTFRSSAVAGVTWNFSAFCRYRFPAAAGERVLLGCNFLLSSLATAD